MSDCVAAPFTHPKNIVVGAGRVIYVDGHNFQTSGWHLPGMRITTDPEEAARAAKVIHQITTDNAGYSGTGFVGRRVLA